MATRNIPAPSNPYASGAVVFDSTPYTEFYVKQQVQEKAKDEALEKYLMDFDKSINPAGMRNNDVPAFLEKIGQNKNFYLKNKEAIKNPALDNGAAYSQWYNANKSALAEISKSKFLAEKDARISKATLDAAKSGKKITDDFQRRLERFRSTPMNSPDFIDINEEEVSFNHKPFDPSSFAKNVFFGLPFSKRVVSSKKDEANKRIVDLVEEYLPENSLPVIKNRAVYEYEKDGGFAEVVDAAIFDEKKIDDLNKLFKPLFKKPIEDKQDLATAIALSLSPIGKTVPISRDDKVAMFNMAEAGRNTRNERSAANRGSEPIVDVWGGIVDAVGKSKTGAIAFNELEPNAQSILLDFAKKTGNDLTQEDVTVYKTPNGDYELREAVSVTDKDGNVVSSRVGKLITPISRQVVNLQGQPSVKEKRSVMSGGKQQPKEVKETKTFVFPKGKTKF